MSDRSADTKSMALFCDFENVALGVREANYQQFDINKVLERLLLKGSIVVKKAYCDWARYREFKNAMHQASFELIEIPHVRMSGKNSADIRMVVDALDLCYTKSHVDTFVIISGDSDFSPLVSKLRENAKTVIGVGVKNSTSDLLINNCDEFIYYDDLVRTERPTRRRTAKAAADAEESAAKAPPPSKKAPAAPTKAPAAPVVAESAGMAEGAGVGEAVAAEAAPAPKRRRSTSRAKTSSEASVESERAGRALRQEVAEEAPSRAAASTPAAGGRRRRASSRVSEPAESGGSSEAVPSAVPDGSQVALESGEWSAPAAPTESMGLASPIGSGEPLDPAAIPGEAPGADDPVAFDRAQQALELVVGTIEALAAERGDDEKIWGSMVKQTLRRRKPGFNESYYGFRSFNRLLEEARDRGLIELQLDDKSGGYTVRSLA